jgi:glutamate-1-semialdehyde 2,1-aminomutase
MASGLATLRVLRKSNPYPELERKSARLCAGLVEAATAAGIPHTCPRVGSMFTLFFNPEPVVGYREAKKSDTQRFAKFFHGMLSRGIYLACSQFEAHFVSTCHTDEDIDATIAAARDVFKTL